MDIFDNFIGERNGVVYCGCNRVYCISDDDDVLEHARHHLEFARITKARAHVPYAYSIREGLKDGARELLRAARSEADIQTAAGMMIRAIFDRSFQLAIEHGVGDLHPTLPEYARTIAEDGQLDPRVNAALFATYHDAPRASGRIKSTLWEPPQRSGIR